MALTADAGTTWRTGFTVACDGKRTRACWLKVHQLHKEGKMEVGVLTEVKADGKWAASSSAALSQQSKSDTKFAAWKPWSGKQESHASERPFSPCRKVMAGDTIGLLFQPVSSTMANVLVWHNSTCFGELAVGFPINEMGFRWAVSLNHAKDHVEFCSDAPASALIHVPRPPAVQWSLVDVGAGIRTGNATDFVTSTSGWQTVGINRTISSLRSVRFSVRGGPNFWLGVIGVRGCPGHHLGQATQYPSTGVNVKTRCVQKDGKAANVTVDSKDAKERALFINEQLAILANHPAYNYETDVELAVGKGGFHARKTAFNQRIELRKAAQAQLDKADAKEVATIKAATETHGAWGRSITVDLVVSDDRIQLVSRNATGHELSLGCFAKPTSGTWYPAVSVHDQGVQVEIVDCT